MVPIRWIFPVGCVFLTLALLALAFGALDGSRSQMWKVASAQIELGERPEWRQFIILSAIQRRVDELNRLRELPDSPARGLPADRSPDPKDNDETAAELQPLAALSIEYPVAAAPEEKPPIDRTPQQFNSRNRMKDVRRRRLPRPQNVFEFPFGNQQAKETPAFSSNNYFGNQQAGQTPTPSVAHQRASRRQRVGVPPSAGAGVAPPGTTPAEQSPQLTSANAGIADQ